MDSETINTVVTMLANNGLAIALCIYYTISYTKQMQTIVNKLDLLTEKVSNLLEKEREKNGRISVAKKYC